MRIIPFRINATKEEDNFSDVYAFLIQGNQKDAYEVEIDIDSLNDIGITDSRCTCPHYTFRASECKHIKECVKILGCFGIRTEFINKANNQKQKLSTAGSPKVGSIGDADIAGFDSPTSDTVHNANKNGGEE